MGYLVHDEKFNARFEFDRIVVWKNDFEFGERRKFLEALFRELFLI